MTPQSSTAWHALEAQAALAQLDSSHQGLTDREAARRLAKFGPNEMVGRKAIPAWRRFLRHFSDPLIAFLLSAAVIAFSLGHLTDAIVITLVVIINAVVGFVQEGRAEQALAALRSMIAPQAHVLRDGKRRDLAVAELVPGDIISLEAGDRVPADARILRARNILVDESVLTGKSVATQKSETPDPVCTGMADRASILYSSTFVVAGQATAVVVATGMATQIGQIGSLLDTVRSVSTPLLQQIATFGRRFTAFALVAAVVLFIFAATLRDYAWLDALMVVVALAVGVVPESLPAVITITLAIGVRRMAARQAIVRRLPAVETLGATTVICSDKTGTLTRNEMTAHSVVTTAGTTTASGTGYAPLGELAHSGDDALAGAQRVATIGLLCNDAQLRLAAGEWRVDGDPMEGALIALAIKVGLDAESLLADAPRIDEIPFDAQHRYMATLHACTDGSALICVKGAPENLLSLSRLQSGETPAGQTLDLLLWDQAIVRAGEQGERVLGFATRRLDSTPHSLEVSDVAALTFEGIVGFIDPPREEAILAVAQCHCAGIDVKMITGDHAATAAAIALQLRLAEHPKVVTGAELETVTDGELVRLAREANVFARATPEHKLRLVRALQAAGETVAMTGDGVNDAPALKQADIGVAMGRKGTEAAKQASGMVLADDNFASIAAAVYEGRAVYDNIRKVIAWTLPTNIGEALAVITALMLGSALPMTPAQILWINMVLTITLGLVLAFEPPEPDIMQRSPRRRNAQLLSPFMLWRIALVSLIFTVAASAIFAWAMHRGQDLATARTMVVNAFCVMEIFYLFSVRYLRMRAFTLQGLRGTPAVLGAIAAVTIAQFAFTYHPWMQAVFDTRPIALLDGLVILMTGVIMMLILELEKLLLRKLGIFEELRCVPGSRSGRAGQSRVRANP